MKASFYFLFIFLFLLSLGATSCKKEGKTIKQTEIIFKKEGELSIFDTQNDSIKMKLDIEIADTDYDVQTGLMYRNAMKANRGMLFIFDDERERYFYMKNTRIPLDIIYINAKNKIVSFQKNAKPFDESSLPSNVPAKFVLEINEGLADKFTLQVGDSISWN